MPTTASTMAMPEKMAPATKYGPKMLECHMGTGVMAKSQETMVCTETATGTITTAYGINIDTNNGGTMTNWYGIRVNAVTGNARGTRYPLIRPLVLLTREPAVEPAREFLEFARSAENRDLVRKHGFVPVAP